jgi:immune inhibitor A
MALLTVVGSASARVDASTRATAAAAKDAPPLKHDLTHPLRQAQDAAHQEAIEAKVRGEATGKVFRTRSGKYVELVREKTDRVFVVIAEFGNTRHAAFPDTVPDGPDPGTDPDPASDALVFDGPEHNKIPQPNRSVDNSTLWQPDYNPAHYENMYFNRMAEYFERQSSNRYSVVGAVHGWVKVPFNEARYGRDVCGGIVCNNTWFLIRDAMSLWVQGQLDSGKTMAEIQSYLKTFDVWDRYDSNGNGNFDEPDGFIDHFQIVHAGGDQAAGDPQQGTDAIWSHRWMAAICQSPTPNPATGCTGLGPGGIPGTQIGQGGTSSGVVFPNNPTGVWVFDYTIQPENGGLGVFAHEYAHDLGLPDLYDTSGNTGGAENSTAFWTLMSSGANIGDGSRNGIGDAPTDLGAWERFQLGWLGCDTCAGGRFYDVAQAGQRSTHRVGANDGATTQASQALFVQLPQKRKDTVLVAPKTGSFVYWSTMHDNATTSMTKPYTIPAGATLTADVWFDIEEHFDYAFLEVSSNGGTTWTPVGTNLSSPASEDQSGLNASGTGIDGSSGGNYVALTANLPGSGAVLVRFRYSTDPAVTGKGFVLDNIAVTGSPVDGAEDASSGWTFNGFKRTTGTETSFHFNAYVVENRAYDGYDASLRTAYNFGFLNTSRPDWVEHYPYQQGVLISYWDESFGDNSVGDHPGGGLILPVDAHPTPEHWADGQLMRQRIQSYDSTFGGVATSKITLHKDGVPTTIQSKPGVPVFDDTKTWWFAEDGHTPASHGRFQVGWTGVNVPKSGTQIKVLNKFTNKIAKIEVGPSPTQ